MVQSFCRFIFSQLYSTTKGGRYTCLLYFYEYKKGLSQNSILRQSQATLISSIVMVVPLQSQPHFITQVQVKVFFLYFNIFNVLVICKIQVYIVFTIYRHCYYIISTPSSTGIATPTKFPVFGGVLPEYPQYGNLHYWY